ncbi:MAG: hypothetical protein JKY86_07645 [Gammaproteobacteria bacterium]|nr:hypothetical protein [Gammaproteobacteria bacterium]
MRALFALYSQLILDLLPAVLDSSLAAITDTPAALRLSGSDVWKASNVRAIMCADIVFSGNETATVTVKLQKTDRDGVTTTIETMTVSVVAAARADNFKYFDVSGIEFDDEIFFNTETTAVGAGATYQTFLSIELEAPLQVAA